jgi:uncharacterized protein YbjQ (UPF0145 family)|nr:heavy metal-binding domain-containing protein [Kofleriaceae bacterium]
MSGADDDDTWVAPDVAPAADLPVHARERLTEMRKKKFFTSDLSVNEFLLVKECGFEPLGLVMGSSIYQIKPRLRELSGTRLGELESMTQALYHARELAMTRMEEEAEALGADGIVAVRLDVNLHAWGNNVAEFLAVGTAVRHKGGKPFRNKKGRPFQSDLSGQDFWTLLKSGYRPVGFVMGNCVYYVGPSTVRGTSNPTGLGAMLNTAQFANSEQVEYTHALYDARELAVERLQDEAEELEATGIVGVTFAEKQHSWRNWLAYQDGNQALRSGELIEFFVFGTAVVPMERTEAIPVPTLVIPVNS